MDQIGEFLKTKKNLVGLIIFLILVIALPIVLYLARTQQIFKPRAEQAAVISRQTPVTIQTTRGIIGLLTVNALSVEAADKTINFSLAETRDYQKIIAGSIETNDVVTSPSAKEALQIGQEVLVIWDKSATQSAKAVYIIR